MWAIGWEISLEKINNDREEMKIQKLIETFQKIDSKKTFKKFDTEVRQILNEAGFKHIGSGSFTCAFGKGKWVVKLCKTKNEKFHNDYGDGYLKPIFVSKNCWLAVQPKADMYTSVCKKIQKLQRLKRKMENYDVKNGNKIVDLRLANIGVYAGEVLMIDLNNHYESAYF